jgi:hypothetical protein
MKVGLLVVHQPEVGLLNEPQAGVGLAPWPFHSYSPPGSAAWTWGGLHIFTFYVFKILLFVRTTFHIDHFIAISN